MTSKPQDLEDDDEIDIIQGEDLNLTMDGNNVDGDDFQKNPVSKKVIDLLEKEDSKDENS